MYYTEDTRENFRFMTIFVVSLVVHVIVLLSIPKFYEEFKREEIKEEKIRAGLVSLVEEKEKKLSTSKKPKKKIEEKVKKEEVKKKEVKTVQKEKPKAEPKKEEAKGVVKVKEEKVEVKKKPLLKLDNISRVERNFDATKVTATTNENALRKKAVDTTTPVFDSIEEKRELKGEDSLNIDVDTREIKEVEANIDLGQFEKVKVGEDYIEANAIGDMKENIETIADIKGEDKITKLPKNVAATSTDVEGGIVEFRKFTSPSYPEAALKNAQSGSVEVEFEIRGSLTIFKGVIGKSGFPQIDRAVELAAREWEFEIKKDGLLANGKVRVKVEFDLKSKR